MFKRFLCAITAALLCLALPVTANAEAVLAGVVAEEITPRYSDTITPKADLVISGSNATCSCSANGTTDIKSISVVMTLEKSGLLGIYSAVSGAKWTKTASGRSISLSGSVDNLSSGTYRVKAVFTVTMKDGSTETITEYSATEKAG